MEESQNLEEPDPLLSRPRGMPPSRPEARGSRPLDIAKILVQCGALGSWKDLITPTRSAVTTITVYRHIHPPDSKWRPTRDSSIVEGAIIKYCRKWTDSWRNLGRDRAGILKKIQENPTKIRKGLGASPARKAKQKSENHCNSKLELKTI